MPRNGLNGQVLRDYFDGGHFCIGMETRLYLGTVVHHKYRPVGTAHFSAGVLASALSDNGSSFNSPAAPPTT